MTNTLFLIDNGQILLNGKLITPHASQKLKNHSPDGFSWGYEGSGCCQTAIAILQSIGGNTYAIKHYQEFKSKIIAKAKQTPCKVVFQIKNENEFILEGVQ